MFYYKIQWHPKKIMKRSRTRFLFFGLSVDLSGRERSVFKLVNKYEFIDYNKLYTKMKPTTKW